MSLSSLSSTKKVCISVWREQWSVNASFSATAKVASRVDAGANSGITDSHYALWVQSGAISSNGEAIMQGSGHYFEPDDHIINDGVDTAIVLRFGLTIGTDSQTVIPISSNRITTAIRSTVVLSHTFYTELSEAVLRLDQVDFPPGAVAYHHTHPGAGIRYLVAGALQLQSAHGIQAMHAGEAWFEDANSPVEATATSSASSCFVRLMLLPVEFEGKPTLSLINAADAHKPRLQTNVRHFDKRIAV